MTCPTGDRRGDALLCRAFSLVVTERAPPRLSAPVMRPLAGHHVPDERSASDVEWPNIPGRDAV